MTAAEITTNLDARELFKSAYENRYTWRSGFPGYTADFELKIQYDTSIGRSGDRILPAGTYSGHVSVPADLTNLNEIKVTGVEDELAAEWITNQIKDVITHRKHSDFESAHSKHTFQLDGEPDTTGAVPIAVSGDAMGSHYKVRDRQIAQVSRVMGRMAFTINHLDKLDTPDGYLSTHYTAVFTDPQDGKVLSQLNFTDDYGEFGGFYLMTRQKVVGQSQGQPTDTEVTFSNIQMGTV